MLVMMSNAVMSPEVAGASPQIYTYMIMLVLQWVPQFASKCVESMYYTWLQVFALLLLCQQIE